MPLPIPGPGRPKGKVPPRKVCTVRIDVASLQWINDNVPRGVSVSAYVNEALREKIAREAKRKSRS